MTVKRWIPWNWFKKEGDDEKSVPVRRKVSRRQDTVADPPLEHFHREIDRLFEQAVYGFDRGPFGYARPFLSRIPDGILKPTLDLGVTDKEYTVTVEIPGVDEEDVQLELVDDTLTLRGEKKQEREEKDQNYYRMERSYGAFQRVLSLPEDVDRERVEATFRKGVLTVTLPRNETPKERVKRIEVRKAA